MKNQRLHHCRYIDGHQKTCKNHSFFIRNTYFSMKNQRFHRSRYIDGVQTSFIFIKKFEKYRYFSIQNQCFHHCRYIDGVQTSFIFIKHWDLAVRSDENPPFPTTSGAIAWPRPCSERVQFNVFQRSGWFLRKKSRSSSPPEPLRDPGLAQKVFRMWTWVAGVGTRRARHKFSKLPTLQFAFRGDFGRGRALLLEVMDGWTKCTNGCHFGEQRVKRFEESKRLALGDPVRGERLQCNVRGIAQVLPTNLRLYKRYSYLQYETWISQGQRGTPVLRSPSCGVEGDETDASLSLHDRDSSTPSHHVSGPTNQGK